MTAVPLPEETPPERVVAEGWATGLHLTAHPVATIRPALDASGVLPIAALDTAPDGAIVTMAGLAAVAQ